MAPGAVAQLLACKTSDDDASNGAILPDQSSLKMPANPLLQSHHGQDERQPSNGGAMMNGPTQQQTVRSAPQATTYNKVEVRDDLGMNGKSAEETINSLQQQPARFEGNCINGNNSTNGINNSPAQTSNGQAHAVASGIQVDDEPPPPIAIVGIGLKLPGDVTTTDEYWDLLVNKRNTRRQVPESRYNSDAFESQFGLPGTHKSTYGHFLDCDLEEWDASFFSMSRAEVEKLDPQQRLLLEVIWECMESGGQKNWRGRNIGCYVGVFGEDWLDLYAKDPQHLGMHRILGGGDFSISNRASYEYDLKGPSMTIRTACSSSLTALHEACQGIYSGECESAVVAGTSLFISPTMTIALSEQGVLSPTGSCKSFDAKADGYARGEAINAIYIKKLDEAIRDGDPIRGVIRATAINFDGKTIGITNPNQESHVALMRRAYSVAKIPNPSDTAFVECHGTGTSVGDPTETGAVGKVFGDHGIYIGSVKPNIGHGEGASGLSSLIKSVLALEHETIPPNINFSEPSPKIKWDKYKFKVPIEPTPWPADRLARVSVNCFGVGGANAHVIVDSAKPYLANQPSIREATPQLLVFSAHQNDSLKDRAAKILEYAEKHSDHLPDIAYTLGARRDALQHRAFAVVDGTSSAEMSPVIRPREAPAVNFIFTGQGAQWGGMGADLLTQYPSFQKDIRSMDAALQKLAHPPSWTIEEELLKPKEESRIQQPEFSQPICTALQIGIVNLLKSWGVRPSAVAGHSSGEIGAAYATGAITLDMAIAIAYYRGQVTQKHGRVGGMAAVGLERSDAAEYLEAGVVIACENSPKNVTLSGDIDRLDTVIARIKADLPDCFARRLRVERAYHSHHMRDIGDMYEKLLTGVVCDKRPSIPFFSSVTAKQIKRVGKLGPAYWRENLESPVLFSPAVQLMLHAATKDTVYLEIGPHSALAGPLRDVFKSVTIATAATYVATLVRNESGVKSMLSSLGRLFQEAVPVDVAATTSGRTVLTDLPNYAWRHENTYWYESRVSRGWRTRKFPPHELLGNRLLESDDLEPTWRNMLRLDNVPWARDHKIQEDIILPAAAYIAMAVEAVRQLQGGGETDASLRQVDIRNALVLRESQAHEIVTHLRPVRLTSKLDSTWFEFSVSSFNGTTWVKHCTGQVRPGKEISGGVEDVETQPRLVSTAGWYRIMKKIGLNYGPAFQGLSDISANPGHNSAAATIANQDQATGPYYPLHPRIIDLVLQAFTVAISDGLTRQFTKLCIPTYIGELYVGNGAKNMRLGVAAQSSATGLLRGSATIMADDRVALSLKDGEFSPLEDAASQESTEVIPAAHLHWKPDIDFVAPINLIRPIRGDREDLLKLERLSLMCVLQTLRTVESLETEERLSKFRDSLVAQRLKAINGELELVQDSSQLANLDQAALAAEIQNVQHELSMSSLAAIGNVLTQLAASSGAIFEGQVRAADLLEQDGGMESVYRLINSRCDYGQYLELLGHANPTMNVLEIGAHPAGKTTDILGGLTNEDGERTYSRYVYTARSDSAFEAAQQKLKGHENMEYKVLDICKDPTEQGFAAGSFDLIISANALHSVPSIQGAIQNVRKLMKPNGRLLLQEFSPMLKMFEFIMGFHPDSWVGTESDRGQEPFVTTSRWDTELRDAGLSGNDCVVLDDDHPYHINASIVSTLLSTPSPPGEVSILCTNPEGRAQELQDVLEQIGFKVSVNTLDEEPNPGADVISLLDLEEPFFYSMSPEDFANFQDFLSKFTARKGLLWVTGHAQVGCKDPRYATTIGASRNVRSELSLDWATLEIDANYYDAESIAIVFEKFRNRIREPEFDPDWEYALVDNSVMVSRYRWIDMSQDTQASVESGPRKLDIARMGQLQTLQWVEDEEKSLKDFEIEIEPRAVGVNFKDVLVAMGIVEGYEPGLGIECSGVVRKVGSSVRHLFPGDRVMAMCHGSFGTRFGLDSNLAVKIPDNLSFEDAATVPCVYATAIHALINLGGLTEGQTVLVHSACGGVGIAALNVCHMMGAKVFATVGNPDKVQYLMDTFGLPREHIFSSRNSSFYEDLMAVTAGSGVDLVLNSLSGELLHVSWKCVAPFGKMLEIGKRDFIGRGQLSMDVFESNRSFHGIDMAQMTVEKPEMCGKVLEQFSRYFEQGALKPITPVTIFNWTEIVDAFRYMQKGQHIGKIVVTMPQNASDVEVAPKAPCAAFRSDASYLLVGGLGGLGRSVSTWMVQNGARHIVFLSRSAGDSERDQLFIRELESQGCAVQTIKGSVTEAQEVVNAVSSAAKPIAGVFLMTMVLRDRGILQLTHDDWFEAANPKVEGALNLHNALEHINLDFFILFSSISYVVGQIGQANYSAANSYLAAFTQFRHSMGLPAAVLNVGVMDDVGYVVENQALLDQFRSLSYHTLKETDLLDALTFMMSHQKPSSPADGSFFNPAELVIGLKSTKSLSDPNNRSVWKRDIRMALAHLKDGECPSASGNEDFSQFMKNATADPSILDVQANREFLTSQIGEVVYSLMSRDVKDLDVNMTLSGLGVDSLVAIEIRNWWRRTLGINTSVLELMGAGSIASLGDLAAEGIKNARIAAASGGS